MFTFKLDWDQLKPAPTRRIDILVAQWVDLIEFGIV
jgi:hypothetical protein